MGALTPANVWRAIQGRNVRVVSMPCTSVFEAQDAGYKQSVLPLQEIGRAHV
mgnify:CR=1 FL=1